MTSYVSVRLNRTSYVSGGQPLGLRGRDDHQRSSAASEIRSAIVTHLVAVFVKIRGSKSFFYVFYECTLYIYFTRGWHL